MKPVLETKSTYKGYPYVVLFMPGAYRCGCKRIIDQIVKE
jgi:hypothetical protein